MPYDRSSKIFRTENIDNGTLYALVDMAFGQCPLETDKTQKQHWKQMIRAYVEVLRYLSMNREYMMDEIDILDARCSEFSRLLVMECGGLVNVTNYFHDIIAGHVVQLTKMYGDLWRFRNEGVEAFNAILSRRRNCFSNLNGAKRSREGAEKRKFLPVESLGNWCLRTGAYQTGLGDEVLAMRVCKAEGIVYDDVALQFVYNTDADSEDLEYRMDKEWKPSQAEDSDDSDSDYGYESEDLDDHSNPLQAAHKLENIKTERRLKFQHHALLKSDSPHDPIPGTPTPHDVNAS